MVRMAFLAAVVILFAVETAFIVVDFKNKKPVSRWTLTSLALGVMVFFELLSGK